MEEFLWTERWRPHKVADVILIPQLKKTFQTFVDQESVPNLLLSGSAGVGKTTIAKAMLDEIGSDYLVINASLEGNIDTLRNKIADFASSVSLVGGRKYVILDEADYLTTATQPALRNFMEEFSANCGFILTCNFKNKVISPLHSRCSVIDFTIPKGSRASLAAEFMKRAEKILCAEKVAYTPEALAAVIMKHLPDWRRVLNELQRYSAQNGAKIDSGILSTLTSLGIQDLIKFMKEKNFTGTRKWIGENLDNDQSGLFRAFYDQASTVVEPASVPELVILIGKYQYQSAFSVDPEVNFAAFCAEAMVGLRWK